MNYFKNEEAFDESRLNSDTQRKVANLIKSLPEEDLSMAWRSSLNMKLMDVQNAKRKQRVTKRIFAWGSSLSAGIAATAYIVLMTNAPSITPTNSRSESVAFASELVKTHQESIVLASVSGTGSSIHETSLTEDSYSPVDDLL
jgi:hypothetical protein